MQHAGEKVRRGRIKEKDRATEAAVHVHQPSRIPIAHPKLFREVAVPHGVKAGIITQKGKAEDEDWKRQKKARSGDYNEVRRLLLFKEKLAQHVG